MKTTAVRLYGKKDLRLESFDLPDLADNQILAKIESDSICMSSYKAAKQGADHKRVPNDVNRNPVIIGHEFCGEIVAVGRKWQDEFRTGDKFSIQPALNYPDAPVGILSAPGYSYQYIGGDAQYIIIPNEVMEQGCLLPFDGDAFYLGSLAEPMSCIVGAFHASYHTSPGTYVHEMGIKEGGDMAILAGVGPMGLGAIDYALHCDRRPGRLVITDIDQDRLDRAASIFTIEEASKAGIELTYVNTSSPDKGADYLRSLTNNGWGYDDVMVFAPVRPVVEQGDQILATDGCLNFFAGPTDQNFSAEFNFYNVHYGSTHIVGTSGGNTDDMKESLAMMAAGKLNPSTMVTHIGGLDAVVDTTLNLPEIPGGKKLIYNHISLPLVALNELAEKSDENPLYAKLAEIVARHNGLWSAEAERYLLDNANKLEL